MHSRKYIHYGNNKYIKEMFRPIRNHGFLTKPTGGLWASPLFAELGWKDWCIRENFCVYSLEKYFTFTLSESANVYHIYKVADLYALPIQTNKSSRVMLEYLYCIDFEKCIELGYDAIELHLSEEDVTGVDFMNRLYFQLYGWDCDSILIMNPEVIVCE